MVGAQGNGLVMRRSTPLRVQLACNYPASSQLVPVQAASPGRYHERHSQQCTQPESPHRKEVWPRARIRHIPGRIMRIEDQLRAIPHPRLEVPAVVTHLRRHLSARSVPEPHHDIVASTVLHLDNLAHRPGCVLLACYEGRSIMVISGHKTTVGQRCEPPIARAPRRSFKLATRVRFSSPAQNTRGPQPDGFSGWGPLSCLGQIGPACPPTRPNRSGPAPRPPRPRRQACPQTCPDQAALSPVQLPR
jgi:hypothetical protein